MGIHSKRFTIQAVNDGFDIVVDGTMFQVLWEQEKGKNALTRQNKNARHDPFTVHMFGSQVNKVTAPTTREQGQARQDRPHSAKHRNGDCSNPERKRALQELEMERKTTYNNLKEAIGKTEAD